MKVYILSTGRCGTTFIQKYLNEQYPELSITHQKKGSRIINILGNIPTENKYYLRFLKFLLKITGRGNPPDSTADPLLTMAILKLARNNELNTNYKIIHLIRDPRDFTISFMNWKSKNFKKWILHHVIPLWQPSPLLHDVNFKEWLSMSKFEKFGWVWNFKNTLINTSFKNHHYHLVKIENLTHPDTFEGTMLNLVNFLGHNVSDREITQSKERINQKINQSDEKKYPSFPNWSEHEKQKFVYQCEPLLMNVGY